MRKALFPTSIELFSPLIYNSSSKILCKITGYGLISLNCERLNNCLLGTGSHDIILGLNSFTWNTSCICSYKEKNMKNIF